MEYVESTRQPTRATVLPVASANQLHQKKMALLVYFKSYIEESLYKEGSRRPAGMQAAVDALVALRGTPGGCPRVTRWFKTKHAIVFRLSHGVLQFNFMDHSKLILEHASTWAVYVSPDRVQHEIDLEHVARRGHVRIPRREGVGWLMGRLASHTNTREANGRKQSQRACPTQADPELGRRLRYACDILAQLMVAGSAPTAGDGATASPTA